MGREYQCWGDRAALVGGGQPQELIRLTFSEPTTIVTRVEYPAQPAVVPLVLRWHVTTGFGRTSAIDLYSELPALLVGQSIVVACALLSPVGASATVRAAAAPVASSRPALTCVGSENVTLAIGVDFGGLGSPPQIATHALVGGQVNPPGGDYAFGQLIVGQINQQQSSWGPSTITRTATQFGALRSSTLVAETLTVLWLA